MGFASQVDIRAYEQEMSYAERKPPANVYDMLRLTAKAHPDRPALSYQITSGPRDRAETLTWQEFHDRIVQAANLFRSLGIGETDVVALILPNSVETATATIGGMVAGIVNPINPLLEAEQIGAILRETGARVVVTLKGFPKTDVAQKTAAAVQAAPSVKTVLEIDLLRYLAPPKSWIVPLIRPRVEHAHNARVLDFHRACRGQSATLTFEPGEQDRVGAYFHTGGTTGMPKVAQHKHSGMVYNGWIGHELLFSENDSIMCPLPLFHVFACHVIMMAALKSGAHVVLPTPAGYRGDGVFDNFWKLCARWKTTFVITVPTAVSALMQRKVDADLSTVKNAFSGSAPMPLELFRRFESATGMQIIEGYGLTETTCLVSCNPVEGEKKVGSVGVPFPYTDVKIYTGTPDGPQECGTDEVGEICISSPGVFVGHTYTEVAKNRDLFYAGKYLRTGDLGRIDADGYLWITGRAKDLIIRGGHNIDPALIEEALMGHEAVAMAGAIGQPDAHAGEIPAAYVELVAGAQVTEADLLDYCRAHMRERAAIPRQVEIMETLPKTAVGKVFKPDLRKQAITRVYNAAMETADCPARVREVYESRKRGLVVRLERNGADTAEVARILGKFIRPWEWADNDNGQ